MNKHRNNNSPLDIVNETPVRVTYRDTDQMGFAYYANYLEWFEIGRTELLRQAGHTYKSLEARNIILPVCSCSCEYKAPARYDDVLVITTRVADLTRASIRFEYEIRRRETNELLATGETKHAFINREGKLLKAGDELRAMLQETPQKP